MLKNIDIFTILFLHAKIALFNLNGLKNVESCLNKLRTELSYKMSTEYKLARKFSSIERELLNFEEIKKIEHELKQKISNIRENITISTQITLTREIKRELETEQKVEEKLELGGEEEREDHVQVKRIPVRVIRSEEDEEKYLDPRERELEERALTEISKEIYYFLHKYVKKGARIVEGFIHMLMRYTGCRINYTLEFYFNEEGLPCFRFEVKDIYIPQALIDLVKERFKQIMDRG